MEQSPEGSSKIYIYKHRTVSTFNKIFRGKNGRRNVVVVLLFLIAIGFVYYKYFGTTTATTYEYATATVKDIKKTVEGSGKVVSVSELDIQQLQNGGKVTSVNVKPGDYVKKGQVIATLDNRQALIQLQQAKASYLKVVNGSTKEEMAITNQSVLNAKQSYEITKQQQNTAVATAKRTLLNTSISPTPIYDSRIQANSPTVSGSYLCSDEEEYNIKFSTYDYVFVTSKSFTGQLRLSSVPQALGECGLYLSFDLTKDYSNGEWKIALPNKIANSYSSNLNSYNNALQTREQALVNAQTAITNAELTLNQKTVGAREEDILSAKASLDSAELNYDNTIIRAPFDGQIGSVSAAVGQQTNSQLGVATIITKDKIAEVSLNEIDIVNVKLGQNVELTFDAIPDEKFSGTVSQIDTVGQTTSNVVSFAVKISIPNADERIKSGMSVTSNIIVEEKDEILTVPSSTIKTENTNGETKKYVMVKPAGNGTSSVSSKTTIRNIKKYVTTGITNDKDTEILDGISEGDQVVSKTVGATAAAKTTSTFSLFGGGAPRAGSTGSTRTTSAAR